VRAGGENPELKAKVREHWDREPCGTRGLESDDPRERLREAEKIRYEVDAHIPAFARFDEARGLRVLEIGVGAGTDFVQWLRAGASAVGIDLSPNSLGEARARVRAEGFDSGEAELVVGDAERLPFADASFDVVYSYGVLHHSPDTQAAIREVHRVLKPGGEARLMVYHVPSWTGLMLWAVHGVARLRWMTPREAIYKHLESPGTKAYTLAEARRLLGEFADVRLETALLAGDLLAMKASEKYRSPLARLAWALYPRGLIRRFGGRLGLGLLITARKARA
jgi:ubiquinone/menaquinone biosynthesis C-methylase UbiE